MSSVRDKTQNYTKIMCTIRLFTLNKTLYYCTTRLQYELRDDMTQVVESLQSSKRVQVFPALPSLTVYQRQHNEQISVISYTRTEV